MYDATVIEETVAVESVEADEKLVLEQLHQLSDIFKKASDVRESHPVVQDLLCYSGHSSWESFCTAFPKQIVEFFYEESPEVITPTLVGNSSENRRLRIALKMQENAIKAKEELVISIAKLTGQLSKMKKAKEEAEVVILENQFNTWDMEAQKKCAKAQANVALLEKQIPIVENQLKAEIGKQNKLNQEARLASARAEASQRDTMVLINTGDPTSDAEIYSKVAGNTAWKIASLYNSIAVLRQQIDKTQERYQALESVTESVFDSQMERLTKLEIACDMQFVIYANCEWGYEICCNTRELDATGYWPDFPPLWKAIREAQARLATSAVKRAQNQAQTLVAMQQSGYL